MYLGDLTLIYVPIVDDIVYMTSLDNVVIYSDNAVNIEYREHLEKNSTYKQSWSIYTYFVWHRSILLINASPVAPANSTSPFWIHHTLLRGPYRDYYLY